MMTTAVSCSAYGVNSSLSFYFRVAEANTYKSLNVVIVAKD